MNFPMKLSCLILTLFFGTLGMVFSQENNEQILSLKTPVPDWTKPYSLPELHKITTPESIESLNGTVLVPRSLFQEREFQLIEQPIIKQPIQVHELPDPQSRMPIKEFDTNVNYTLQIKKYK